MFAASKPQQLSWRDPSGFVISFEGRILRAVAIAKAEQTRALIQSPWMARLMAEGSIPTTAVAVNLPPAVEQTEQWFWLEHHALPFPCYPHEITALQLFDAGQLTLMVAMEAAQHGWMLKDASAWNVLYDRGRPVFVDLLSFDRLEATGTWIAYGQFVRNFLLPLLLHSKQGITPQEIFLTNRDGITPERAYQWLRAANLMSATGMELVVLPKWLTRRGGQLIAAQSVREPRKFEAALGEHLLLGTLRRLQRILERLRPNQARSKSVWHSYEEERRHYSPADLLAKKEFVREGLQDTATVLDLGCNAGEYSLLAAECGKTVVAADADHPALSRLYARIRGNATPITPLLLNIGRPTPAVGWQNREVASFIDRSGGQFDCILFLGLIHHLLVSERATLPMIADLLDSLDPKRVIMEWVDPKDPKFQQLAGLNSALYGRLDRAGLEDTMRGKFRMIKKLPLPCTTRVMYLWCR
jgi:SAM-dependent methyltransferase